METMKTGSLRIFVVLWLSIFLSGLSLYPEENDPFYVKGRLYQDWMGSKGSDTEMYSRMSSRLKLTLWNKPGAGWTVDFDVRNRYTFGDYGGNQLIIYDAKIFFDSLKSKLFLSLGQMNLYDLSGIGGLTGVLAGVRPLKYISLGGYYGIEPDIYNSKFGSNYKKFGGFIKYQGPGARRISLSYNHVVFDGNAERTFLNSVVLFPFKRLFSIYGSAEYELAENVLKEDRLARLFLNFRLNISKSIYITSNYSSGRGLDYHRFILNQEQNSFLNISEIERYYYNTAYGIRLTVKPWKKVRISLSRRESERVDEDIRNHITRFHFALQDLFRSGVSLSGNYSLNRGDRSESDSYYFSTSKYFGKFSLSLSVSSYYNFIYTGGTGTPEIVYIPDRSTVHAGVFYILNRNIAFSLDYSYSFREDFSENRAFIRMIIRK